MTAIDSATTAMRWRAETNERWGNAMVSSAWSGEEGMRRASPASKFASGRQDDDGSGRRNSTTRRQRCTGTGVAT
ncbi:hypothetical protein E2562_034348 [Oryza meyeriana var. granulata]|uniref:Uncharacterized protein n=1 Tax=Oryza meyeriana var. granulata TaxID=110450 RepID=A0A6G1EC66_9ORYZ|nr:hypothetical protein E2562_034348 [Oryza meyeriana var. granulata]